MDSAQSTQDTETVTVVGNIDNSVQSTQDTETVTVVGNIDNSVQSTQDTETVTVVGNIDNGVQSTQDTETVTVVGNIDHDVQSTQDTETVTVVGNIDHGVQSTQDTETVTVVCNIDHDVQSTQDTETVTVVGNIDNGVQSTQDTETVTIDGNIDNGVQSTQDTGTVTVVDNIDHSVKSTQDTGTVIVVGNIDHGVQSTQDTETVTVICNIDHGVKSTQDTETVTVVDNIDHGVQSTQDTETVTVDGNIANGVQSTQDTETVTVVDNIDHDVQSAQDTEIVTVVGNIDHDVQSAQDSGTVKVYKSAKPANTTDSDPVIKDGINSDKNWFSDTLVTENMEHVSNQKSYHVEVAEVYDIAHQDPSVTEKLDDLKCDKSNTVGDNYDHRGEDVHHGDSSVTENFDNGINDECNTVDDSHDDPEVVHIAHRVNEDSIGSATDIGNAMETDMQNDGVEFNYDSSDSQDVIHVINSDTGVQTVLKIDKIAPRLSINNSMGRSANGEVEADTVVEADEGVPGVNGEVNHDLIHRVTYTEGLSEGIRDEQSIHALYHQYESDVGHGHGHLENQEIGNPVINESLVAIKTECAIQEENQPKHIFSRNSYFGSESSMFSLSNASTNPEHLSQGHVIEEVIAPDELNELGLDENYFQGFSESSGHGQNNDHVSPVKPIKHVHEDSLKVKKRSLSEKVTLTDDSSISKITSLWAQTSPVRKLSGYQQTTPKKRGRPKKSSENKSVHMIPIVKRGRPKKSSENKSLHMIPIVKRGRPKKGSVKIEPLSQPTSGQMANPSKSAISYGKKRKSKPTSDSELLKKFKITPCRVELTLLETDTVVIDLNVTGTKSDHKQKLNKVLLNATVGDGCKKNKNKSKAKSLKEEKNNKIVAMGLEKQFGHGNTVVGHETNVTDDMDYMSEEVYVSEDEYTPTKPAKLKKAFLKSAKVKKESRSPAVKRKIELLVTLDENVKKKIKEERPPIDRTFDCGRCDFVTTQKCLIEKHYKETHSVTYFVCHYCNRRFRLEYCLLEHVAQKHTKDKIFLCPIENCEYAACNKYDVYKHQSKHAPEKSHVCTICGWTTRWRNSMSSHHLMAHTDKKNFKCKLCNYKCKRNSDLKQHMYRHTEEKPIECLVCGFRVKTNWELTSHMFSHSDEKPFKCTFPGCQAATKTNADRLKHMRKVHTSERNFVCPICSKAYKDQHGLNVHHAYIHTDARPVRCDICNKTFRAKSYLQRHVALHSGVKPFSCSICQKKFAVKFNMLKHMKTHDFKNRPFRCPLCPHGSKEPGHLLAHIGAFHGDSYCYFCELCKKPFERHAKLILHYQRMHKSDLRMTEKRDQLDLALVKMEMELDEENTKRSSKKVKSIISKKSLETRVKEEPVDEGYGMAANSAETSTQKDSGAPTGDNLPDTCNDTKGLDVSHCPSIENNSEIYNDPPSNAIDRTVPDTRGEDMAGLLPVDEDRPTEASQTRGKPESIVPDTTHVPVPDHTKRTDTSTEHTQDRTDGNLSAVNGVSKPRKNNLHDKNQCKVSENVMVPPNKTEEAPIETESEVMVNRQGHTYILALYNSLRLPLATKGFEFNYDKSGKKPNAWFMDVSLMRKEDAQRQRAYLKRTRRQNTCPGKSKALDGFLKQRSEKRHQSLVKNKRTITDTTSSSTKTKVSWQISDGVKTGELKLNLKMEKDTNKAVIASCSKPIASDSVVTKKKRGRPPKRDKTDCKEKNENIKAFNGKTNNTSHNKRGRPPKSHQTDCKDETNIEAVNRKTNNTSHIKRGRPPKSHQTDCKDETNIEAVNRKTNNTSQIKRGRPPKSHQTDCKDETNIEAVNRKTNNTSQIKRGRPPKSHQTDCRNENETNIEPVSGKTNNTSQIKRGRPPKSHQTDCRNENETNIEPVSGKTNDKLHNKRGRPRKSHQTDGRNENETNIEAVNGKTNNTHKISPRTRTELLLSNKTEGRGKCNAKLKAVLSNNVQKPAWNRKYISVKQRKMLAVKSIRSGISNTTHAHLNGSLPAKMLQKGTSVGTSVSDKINVQYTTSDGGEGHGDIDGGEGHGDRQKGHVESDHLDKGDVDANDNKCVHVAGNKSFNVGENRSNNVGENRSNNVGENRSNNVGENRSNNVGENRSNNVGENQSDIVGDNRSVDARDDKYVETGDDKSSISRIPDLSNFCDDTLVVGKSRTLDRVLGSFGSTLKVKKESDVIAAESALCYC